MKEQPANHKWWLCNHQQPIRPIEIDLALGPGGFPNARKVAVGKRCSWCGADEESFNATGGNKSREAKKS